MTVKKRFEVSVLLALLFLSLLSAVRFEANCLDLEKNILRLHVVANSDSDFDQALKLKVRNEVLKASEEVFAGVKSKDDAIKLAKQNREKFTAVAKEVILKSGKNYTVGVKTENKYFPQKNYGNFTLPAGNYDALSITIGSAKGHNWWCVLFPEVCLSASADIAENLSKSSAKTVLKPQNYKVEFKVAEVYSEIKNKLFLFFS